MYMYMQLKCGGVEFGTTGNKSKPEVTCGMEFEVRTQVNRMQTQHPNHWTRPLAGQSDDSVDCDK